VQAIILGAGASGVLHALALRAAGVRIVAIFDPDAERARNLAQACGARVISSLASAVSVDAGTVAICSPPNVHVMQAEAMCAAGSERIVLVEKPVATSIDELARLRQLPRCVPVLQWRAGRGLRAIRRAVAHGELGSAPTLSCDLVWARDAAYFRARRGWGCGALLSIGIHAIDAMGWVLDADPVGAAGLCMTREEGDGETAAVGVLRFAGGSLASFRLSLDGGGDATTVSLSGNGRTVWLEGGEADPTGTRLRWSGRDHGDSERLASLERETPGALGSPLLVPYIGAVIAALRDGERPGDSQRLPPIESTFAAHAAAMQLATASRSRTSCC
jgi:predicted dehydrogenase